MKRIITSLLLVTYFCAIGFGQAANNQGGTGANGAGLTTLTSVGESLRVHAVLIPRVDARRIFGEEIANNYAVVEVNIGNKSPDASFILHGIYIDYSRWALRGGEAKGAPSENIDGRYQRPTYSNQIASEEYRVVRGQFLDAKMWTKRAWTMRLLTFAGSLAGAYPFPVGREIFTKQLSAFSGVFVPGVREVWPDSTIEQLNNISDFGYRTNRAIPKQGAEIVVGFFPIERFLTPGFKKLYLRSPALFFAPLQMLLDKKIEKDVNAALNLGFEPSQMEDLRRALPCYVSIKEHSIEKPAADYEVCLTEMGLQENEKDGFKVIKVIDVKKAASFRTLTYLDNVSLNNVTVVVDGVMSVNTTAIAAKVDEIGFDAFDGCASADLPCFWADTEAGGGVRTGFIKGAYFTGGSLVIDEKDRLKLKDFQVITDKSNDQIQRFSFKLTDPIGSDTKIHFKVTKPNPAGGSAAPLESNVREYLIHYPAPPQPTISDVAQDKPEKGKLTIKGSGFIDSPTYPLQVKLTKPDGTTMTAKVLSRKVAELIVEMPSGPAGCWNGSVLLGGALAAQQTGADCFCFFIAPAPKLNSATLEGKTITLDGEELLFTQDCRPPGPTLAFVVSKGDKTAAIERAQGSSDGSTVTLQLKAGAPDVDDTWVVKALLAGVEVKDNGTAAIKKKAP